MIGRGSPFQAPDLFLHRFGDFERFGAVGPTKVCGDYLQPILPRWVRETFHSSEMLFTKCGFQNRGEILAALRRPAKAGS